VIVDPEKHGHFFTVSDSIHLNPVRAGPVKPGEDLASERWSSYPCAS
jgi:hypothetical protein